MNLDFIRRVWDDSASERNPRLNSRQLKNLGVPADCVKSAVAAIRSATQTGGLRRKQLKETIKNVVARPSVFLDDVHFGRFASDVIHRLVSKLLGAEIVTGVENHHNFAWKEIHRGRELVVHRKGATPAGKGVLGVIPGSMASPAFVVRGRGNPTSFDSASHGAGRVMSRRKAKETFHWKNVQADLMEKGVTVLSAGADEVPGLYKNINDVMDAQSDLVEILSRFDPKIVKMCGDGSKAED